MLEVLRNLATKCASCSVMSNCSQPHGAHQALLPWDSPGKNTRVGSHSLLQRIFPTQGLSTGLLHCRQTCYCLSHEESVCSRVKGQARKGLDDLNGILETLQSVTLETQNIYGCIRTVEKSCKQTGLLEGLMLKLKFQYFGHLMRRVDSLEKALMLGGIRGRRRRG